MVDPTRAMEPPITVAEIMALNKRNLEILRNARDPPAVPKPAPQASSPQPPATQSVEVLDPNYQKVCNEVIRGLKLKEPGGGAERICTVTRIYKDPEIHFVNSVMSATELSNILKSLTSVDVSDAVAPPEWIEQVRVFSLTLLILSFSCVKTLMVT